MTKLHRALKTAGLSALAVFGLTAAGAAFLLWWMHEGVFSTQQFDTSIWERQRRVSLNGECARGPMANDIIRSIATPGNKRSAVEAKLGAPDSFKHKEAQYELGMCSGLRIDYDTLHIEYENDVVVKARHLQH